MNYRQVIVERSAFREMNLHLESFIFFFFLQSFIRFSSAAKMPSQLRKEKPFFFTNEEEKTLTFSDYDKNVEFMCERLVIKKYSHPFCITGGVKLSSILITSVVR